MALPEFRSDGSLPPGLHAGWLAEVRGRFGIGSLGRQQKASWLAQVVSAAVLYPTMKRVLVWGRACRVESWRSTCAAKFSEQFHDHRK